MERYKQLKDLPGIKAGAVWEKTEDSPLNYYYLNGFKDYCRLIAGNIENNPEWFKKEEEKKLKDLIKETDIYRMANYVGRDEGVEDLVGLVRNRVLEVFDKYLDKWKSQDNPRFLSEFLRKGLDHDL